MKNKKYLGYLFVLLFSFFAIKPLFVRGFFPMHDDTQPSRVYEMKKALQDGMFPVRWAQDLGYGYGYPIFNFYAPLSYYIGGSAMLFYADAITATKIMMGLGILLAGVFMYFFAREVFGEIGGVVSAVFYVFAPYHALDIYVRGDVAELWAYAFMPLVFLGTYAIFSGKMQKGIIVGSLGLSGTVLSHNLTAFMLIPFLLFFPFFLPKESLPKKLWHFFIMISLGVLLSAFYWLPALSELKYANVVSQIGGPADFRNHFVCIKQLWDSPWGFGGSVPGCADGLSFRIGKLHLLITFISLLVFFFRKHIKQRALLFFSLAGLLCSLFMTLSQSQFIWETIPWFSYLQYPWRYLLFASFFSSLLAGSIFFFLKDLFKNTIRYIALPLIVLVVFLNVKLFNPQTVNAKISQDYTSLQNLRFDISKISDEYMPKDFKKPPSEHEAPKNKISSQPRLQTVSFQEKTNSISAYVFAEKNIQTQLNLAYFPSWKVTLDKMPVLPGENVYPLILSYGSHQIEARFRQTPIEQVSNALSIIGLAGFILAIIRKRYA